MNNIAESIPITDLSQSAVAVVESVRLSQEPIVITQQGKAAAVMLSIEEYERSQNEREMLLQLARGEKEIAAGKGYDWDSILAEMDALLAGDAP